MSDRPPAPSRSGIRLIDRARRHAGRIAIVDAGGEHPYAWLDARSRFRAVQLLDGRRDLEEERVSFLMPPGLEYVVTQWAIWRAGGVAVPLSPLHPDPEVEYILDDTGCGTVIAADEFDPRLRPLAEARGIRYRSVPPEGYTVEPLFHVLSTDELERAEETRRAKDAGAAEPEAALPEISSERRAMILYTSGTTSRPKGVVSTHAAIEAQVRSIIEAWRVSRRDRLLHILPLHHTHGIVAALTSTLCAGGCVEMPGRFDAAEAWEAFADGRITLFMAVPTVYVKLLSAWEAADQITRARWSKGARGLRLMVSGSAALPETVFARWEEVTSHRLLERYGMTEIGMGLTNPLRGERRPGTVGQPLPGVEVRLVADDGRLLAEGSAVHAPGETGEIRVRGPGVFEEYWSRPAETREAFEGGWFRTGDEATVEDGYYRILGRSSVDIIKTGGYKVSAIEVEECLRGHPAVRDCAVVGAPDPEWGECVCAAIEAEPGADHDALGEWARARLAPYKVPRRWLTVEALPRNAMGKVRKPAVRAMFESEAPEGSAQANDEPIQG